MLVAEPHAYQIGKRLQEMSETFGTCFKDVTLFQGLGNGPITPANEQPASWPHVNLRVHGWPNDKGALPHISDDVDEPTNDYYLLSVKRRLSGGHFHHFPAGSSKLLCAVSLSLCENDRGAHGAIGSPIPVPNLNPKANLGAAECVRGR